MKRSTQLKQRIIGSVLVAGALAAGGCAAANKCGSQKCGHAKAKTPQSVNTHTKV